MVKTATLSSNREKGAEFAVFSTLLVIKMNCAREAVDRLLLYILNIVIMCKLKSCLAITMYEYESISRYRMIDAVKGKDFMHEARHQSEEHYLCNIAERPESVYYFSNKSYGLPPPPKPVFQHPSHTFISFKRSPRPWKSNIAEKVVAEEK